MPSGVWLAFDKCVALRPRIRRMFDSPIVDLVQDPDTLEVFGAIVEHKGQRATIDTHNGTIPAAVTRVEPAVQGGTVLVELALTGPLPAGARPDLSIEGIIEIERLADVLYVGRPAFGQPGATVSLFRLDPDGEGAQRTAVKLGRSSSRTIEVAAGLREGDQVVLSDTSQWDAVERVALR